MITPQGTLSRFALDGSELTNFDRLLTNQVPPTTEQRLRIARHQQRVYALSHHVQQIIFVDLDTERTIPFTEPFESCVSGMAVDENFVYWACNDQQHWTGGVVYPYSPVNRSGLYAAPHSGCRCYELVPPDPKPETSNHRYEKDLPFDLVDGGDHLYSTRYSLMRFDKPPPELADCEAEIPPPPDLSQTGSGMGGVGGMIGTEQ